MPNNDLEILKAAKETARENVEKEPSRAHLDAFDKASRMLADYLAGDREPAFDNVTEVVKYLNRLGYKLGKTKAYKDAEKGLLRRQAGGAVLESDVKAYISKAGLVKPDQVVYDIESSDLMRKKQKREVQKLTAQVEKLDFENKILKGEHVRRDESEMKRSITAGVFRESIRHVHEEHARGSIKLDDAQSIVNYWNAHTDDMFDKIARMEKIEVTVRGLKV